MQRYLISFAAKQTHEKHHSFGHVVSDHNGLMSVAELNAAVYNVIRHKNFCIMAVSEVAIPPDNQQNQTLEII